MIAFQLKIMNKIMDKMMNRMGDKIMNNLVKIMIIFIMVVSIDGQAIDDNTDDLNNVNPGVK